MITLALLLLGLAIVAAQAYASAGRPLPVAEAIPLSALGLTWRREKDVVTRRGPRSLWFGLGDPAAYRRAFELSREAMGAAGYSWTDGIIDGRAVGRTPCCWAPVPADEAAAEAAVVVAEAALVRDAAEVEALGIEHAACLDRLRVSLDTLYWAWPPKKKVIAEALLAAPLGSNGYPTAEVSQVAWALFRQVKESVEKVRERLARDPAHDWVARAQLPGVPAAVHDAVRLITSHDVDRASVQNGIGWGKSHTHTGHILAALPELSVIQASSALSAVWRHRRQVPAQLRQACFGSAEA
ncbi:MULTISPECIES: hypothetical protein [Methylobacteriaceae]|uniref:hypothetical protein n=1 Tax=Methylobacteriaceae TaxID=119045 RepID=UPI000CDA319F|nr:MULTISPECIES: hypothetical protein [Methylobacteriaceae]MCP1549370.1 hypothetical protein [Methylorubrum zatmanii]MCP1554017.1 hypothetical protein [Methylorubrum extorquens]MCP1579672.1 hypothetical protein [Methylorubrum extorquens]POR41028.1 hypothetical protein CRT23_20545 [Methylobacterium sp. V23]